ncbi:MAG: transcriptional regulator [Spirosoma sp.]|nr:transcriptional regulator [Spirosoma sp.]
MDANTGRPRNVTLKDVAALAGVSIATASKALNNRGYVHVQTRARVIEAAEKVSFTPNSLAKGLLAGRTGTIGLLTNDLEGRFSIPVLMGAEDASGTGKMSVLLCDARGDAIRESYHLQALLARRVDGLIVVGSSTDPRKSLGSKLPVPVVYAYGPSEDPGDLSLVPDNIAGGFMAVSHLLGLGRRTIAHITGEKGYLAARDRAEGALRRLDEAGLGVAGGEVLYGDWSEAWGRSATSSLLDREPNIDAVFCGSDQIARGALDAIRDRGLLVPDDIAVIGFDDWEVLTTGSRPQLSSVNMDLEALGRHAARKLFAAIEGTDSSGVEKMPCRLVIRGSTVRVG